jgi:hypothetical protein
MNIITYAEAEEIVLNWYKSNTDSPFVVAFIDSTCENCNEFEHFAIPEIENSGISAYAVDVRSTQLAFPPSHTPTTYWYFIKEAPPLIKKGAPPTKIILLDLISKVLKINRGESTIETEFF